MRANLLSTVFVITAIGRCIAQTPTTSRAADTACSYESCALSIAPAWDGLRVVRGSAGQRVANLHFFWPTPIEDALRGTDRLAVGADSSAAHARRAVQIRQVGAGFTDAGALAIAAALLRSIGSGHVSTRSQVIAGVGLGALAISVPLQFGADGELSRAVWWHNLRYVRPPAPVIATLGPEVPIVRPQAPPERASLAGTWDVEYTLDSADTEARSSAVRRVRGRLMFADVGGETAGEERVRVKGRFLVDFAPLFGAGLGRDVIVADAGQVDSIKLVTEVAGTFVGMDSVRIDLVPRSASAGVSMSGRIRGDSASGTWVRRATCCGEFGHFRMSRIDRTPVVLALPRR
ncbi:MAG TPA: hypothetical protein VH539_10695 [Gemmatimonadaceae bacterium]